MARHLILDNSNANKGNCEYSDYGSLESRRLGLIPVNYSRRVLRVILPQPLIIEENIDHETQPSMSRTYEDL